MVITYFDVFEEKCKKVIAFYLFILLQREPETYHFSHLVEESLIFLALWPEELEGSPQISYLVYILLCCWSYCLVMVLKCSKKSQVRVKKAVFLQFDDPFDQTINKCAYFSFRPKPSKTVIAYLPPLNYLCVPCFDLDFKL